MAQRIVPVKHDEARRVATLLGPQNITSMPAKIVDTAAGPVTWSQKLRGYYKALIALSGAVVTVAAQLAPVIPEADKGWVTKAVVVATAIGVALKENQHWIEGPPPPTQPPGQE